MIIRELQRTNLDVNLAVNNLLSRDDEDGDDGDDTASESYLPGGLFMLRGRKKKKRKKDDGQMSNFSAKGNWQNHLHLILKSGPIST